ncbi:MAG: hypothetical protein HZB10_01205 [Candidatus Yonathbacteria bacterium]|nr:hypothetical protein [Candidatus Yonathbacteria bacterium]
MNENLNQAPKLGNHTPAPVPNHASAMPPAPLSKLEKWEIRMHELSPLIAKKKAELKDLVEQMSDAPIVPRQSYSKLMGIMKDEIQVLEAEMDSLHETIN